MLALMAISSSHRRRTAARHDSKTDQVALTSGPASSLTIVKKFIPRPKAEAGVFGNGAGHRWSSPHTPAQWDWFAGAFSTDLQPRRCGEVEDERGCPDGRQKVDFTGQDRMVSRPRHQHDRRNAARTGSSL